MPDVNFGTPTELQLAQVNKLAKKPLTTEEVFVFSGKSAGDMPIPGRYMSIHKSLLQVMAEDARKGVSFMYNHNWAGRSELQGVPYGKVFDGNLKASAEANEVTELHLSRYIVRDDEQIAGMSANALIRKIETGVLSDTSISFDTDVMTCSICGNNYYSKKCSHYRGGSYEMDDGTTKVCTVMAMPPSVILPQRNNALMEESIVWDGAYPGASVSQSSVGDLIELPDGQFSILGEKDNLPEGTMFMNRYHNGDMVTLVKKSENAKVFGMGSPKEPEEDKLNKEPKGVEQSVNENLKKALEALGIEFEGETMTDDVMDALATRIEELKADSEALALAEIDEKEVVEYLSEEQVKDALGGDMTAETVLELAKEGQAFKTKLIDDTIAMGVRAMGNDFKAETWKNTLSDMDTKSIGDIMDGFAKQAGEEIPAGRQTPLDAGKGKEISQLPDEAFR